MKDTDPDFSMEVVEELYHYQHKRVSLAFAYAVLGGIFGAHRFYLGRTLTGLVMLLTVGGGLFWWLWDLFKIRSMVQVFNREEDARAQAHLPPQGLGFLPRKQDLKLSGPPPWANKRRSRVRVFGSAFALSLIGLSIGSISGATQIFEPVLIIVAFIIVTLTSARWKGLSQVPILNGLVRWNHRLRLYYYTVDPGSIWLLALRPVAGVLFAPWRARAHAEVKLYLQLGVLFSLLFAVSDLLDLAESDSLQAGVALLVGEFFQTLVYTYAFVAPIGALLTTQLLLSRRDRVVWVLSGITILFTYLGLLMVGAV